MFLELNRATAIDGNHPGKGYRPGDSLIVNSRDIVFIAAEDKLDIAQIGINGIRCGDERNHSPLVFQSFDDIAKELEKNFIFTTELVNTKHELRTRRICVNAGMIAIVEPSFLTSQRALTPLQVQGARIRMSDYRESTITTIGSRTEIRDLLNQHGLVSLRPGSAVKLPRSPSADVA